MATIMEFFFPSDQASSSTIYLISTFLIVETIEKIMDKFSMPFMGTFPPRVIFDEKSNVFETCSSIISSSEDMRS